MRYHDITKDDMKNGPGLRTVLWVAGCSHACPGCHNPVTWDECGGLEFDQAAKEELFDLLSRDYISGLTFSGGDPLHPANRAAVLALAHEVRTRFPDKNIWLYTGYTFEEAVSFGLNCDIDVVVDGRYVEAQRDNRLHWRGSANQRVIDVKRSLAAGGVVLFCD